MNHGLRSTYTVNGCRCDECKAANTEYFRKLRQTPAEERRSYAPAAHGRLSRYRHGCRCDLCREANTEQARTYRARKRAERAAA